MLFALSFAGNAQDKTYYVSPDGNDANSGLSAATPWQTLSRINSFSFQAGDSILLEGGRVFTGTISFWSDDKGSAINPIVLSSYGAGRARVDAAGGGNGLMAYNTGGIEVRNLVFSSNGATANQHNGVEFYTDTTINIDYVVIDDVEAYGFGTRGISIGAWGNEKGFTNVRIQNCVAHDNGQTGIETYGHWPRYSHRNIYVGYCKAYNNFGRKDLTTKHSGSGIILSGVDGATIEYCEAYANGKNNGHKGGGPVGIWFYDVKNGVIQYSESHHNQAGLEADGGGFDIDGGSQNCIIQYCYSHDNEGAGFGMYEYGSSNAFVGNVIRYNISENDARKNSDGALAFWGVNSTHKVTNSQVYNNTVYMNNTGVVNGTPSAVKVIGNSLSGVTIRNNIFHIGTGVRMLRATAAFSTSALLFQNNNYFAEGSTANFLWAGTNYASLAEWKVVASGQEMSGITPLGKTVNPYFVQPGGGSRVGPAEGGDLTTIEAYQLQAGSPMIDAGINLKATFGINTGDRDFYNNTLASGATYDIGAHEISLSTLPLDFIDFSATVKGNLVKLAWTVAGDEVAKSFQVEKSSNGKDFELWAMPSAAGWSGSNSFSIQLPAPFEGQFYCRVKAGTESGKTSYSKIIPVRATGARQPVTVFPNPATHWIRVEVPAGAGYDALVLWGTDGRRLMQRTINGSGPIVLDVQHLGAGIYYLELSGNTGAKERFPVVKQ